MLGPLFDQIKRDAFEAAEVCILPSYSEGAPLVVLESLGAARPMIVTHASPWRDLLTQDCGWWPEIDRDSIGRDLLSAMLLPPAELKAKGDRGRALVESGYRWSTVAQRTEQLYTWLGGKGEKPSFIFD